MVIEGWKKYRPLVGFFTGESGEKQMKIILADITGGKYIVK